MFPRSAGFVSALFLVVGAALNFQPAFAQSNGPLEVADTVSPEATRELKAAYELRSAPPSPDRAAALAARSRDLIARLGVTLVDDQIGGVKVVRIRPVKARATGWTLLYLHGGGYVAGSTQALIYLPALIADRTGAEVISIEYTLAPQADWRGITTEVVSVWRGLLAKGMDARAAAIFGDSAGGGLTAGVTLRLRDEGVALPAALYLVSPWSDISGSGDTDATLAASDPILDPTTLKTAAAMYAKPADQRLAYVSPVYGDYSRDFPPTLIQCGTREMFVSNCVREYQAIRAGDHEAVLDMYEGMPHAFPALAPDSPETNTAIARAAAFFEAHFRNPG